MGIFRDDYGLRPWVVGVVVSVAIFGLIYGFIYLVVKADLATNKESCARVAEMTQRQTSFMETGWSGVCYIRVDDGWIPLNNWRVN